MTADVAQLIRQSVPWVVLLWVACSVLGAYERGLELAYVTVCIGTYTPDQCKVNTEAGARPSLTEVEP